MQGTTGSVRPLFNASVWVPHTRCPAVDPNTGKACQSADIRTYGPRQEFGTARVRYHECRTCKALFKSVEDTTNV